MKVSFIVSLIILLFIFQINAIKKAPTCNPLTLKCRCSNVQQLVCGESGKTHTNPCIANCFNDKIKHVGACTNQCKTSTQKCKWLSFGLNGGKRKRCCDQSKVCFGKTCTETEKNCKWIGNIVIKKRKGTCFWKRKSARKYQRICCKWMKVCKGSCEKGTRRCFTTLKKCKWTGRVIITKKNKSCSFINSENGKRKRCCTFKTKCINYDKLTCKSRRKPKCWVKRTCKFEGPFIKKKCSRKCQYFPVGKYGKRKKCCHSCRTCESFKFTETPNKRPDVCATKLNKCYWKGDVVVIRFHRKCAIKPYGENKDRKRCCKWGVKCVKKNCKTIHKKCRWVGCVITTNKKRFCRFRMKNDHQKQKFCCSFTKRCCGSKCVNYNQKCKFTGKIITTHHHWKCKMENVGKFGKKRKCCRFKRVCFGKKCSKKLVKCVWKGCLKTSKIVRKCSLKTLTKNIKCKFCCSSVRKCDCGLCRTVNRKCKCVKRYTYFHFTKCSKALKRKNVKQIRCCKFKKVCRNKKCRVLRTKKCKWTGFEEIIEYKRNCKLKKVSKNSKRRHCCKWIRKCFGLKCVNTKKKCYYVGLEISKKFTYKCKIRRYKNKNTSRKRCCSILTACIGLRCRAVNKKCKWIGNLYKRKTWRRVAWKKVNKNCKRRQKCLFKQHCFGLKCSKVRKSCVPFGKTVCHYRRIIKSWKKTRKDCVMRKLCSVSSVCINNECKSSKPQCRLVGKEVCNKTGSFCKWSLFDGKCFKKRCCQVKSKCVGDKCTRKLFACQWNGKLKCIKKTIKCKVETYKKFIKRKKCCLFENVCYDKKCSRKIKWCKWKGSNEKYKVHKKCALIPIKKHKYIMIKRKRCIIWRRTCVKGICKSINIKTYWEGKKIIIRRFRKCSIKKFSSKYDRSHCCRFTRVCQGKKCRDLKRGCFWFGKKIIRKIETLLRWKVICRDVPFGKNKKIRLNCCKVQQRCYKTGPAFRCENIKRSKCWWRGAIRGDVWIQDQNGNWKEVNAAGSFKYLDDKENGYSIDTQFTQKGFGSITSSVILNSRNNVIKANQDGSIYLNNKLINLKPKKGLILRFIKNKVVQKLLKKNVSKKQLKTIYIAGLTEENIVLIYDVLSKSYQLTVTASSKSTGLFVDPSSPQKYQLQKNQSKFNKYVEFSLIKPKEGTPEERVNAMKCCHLLKSESKLHKCISDFIRTKTCLVQQYSNNNNPNKAAF